jgi:hypothetical protein
MHTLNAASFRFFIKQDLDDIGYWMQLKNFTAMRVRANKN